jgi:Protein of unknown function (DUF3455)
LIALLHALVAATWLILAVSAASAARAQSPTLPELPAAIKPGDLKPYLAVAAKGVQIYACGKTGAGAWSWSFTAPQADLTDSSGRPVGKHYAGPTWEGNDGGKVVGTVKASAPSPSANAIAWLWLDVKAREGSGAFTQGTGILRVATIGGAAPATGCDEARSGSELRVPYTATYFFLR